MRTTTGLIAILLFTNTTFAAFGDLDTTFGSNGYLSLDNGLVVSGVVRQADGKLIVVGYSVQNNGSSNITHSLLIKRFNANGSLDLSYGFNGFAIPYYPNIRPISESIQSDGKLILVGEGPTISNYQKYVMRFNTNGVYDSGFGTNGRINAFSGAYRIASFKLTSNATTDKILVSNEDKIRMYNSNGSIRTSFGPYGNGDLNNVGGAFLTNSATLVSNSSIVVGSFFDTSTVVLRGFDGNGQVNTAFGNGGLTFSYYSGQYFNGAARFFAGIERTPGGKILIAGQSGSYQFPISFVGIHSANGFLETSLSPISSNGARAVTANSDGTVIYFGILGTTSKYSATLALTDEANFLFCTGLISLPDSKFICNSSGEVSRHLLQ